jgi:hypothetical protein
MRPKVVFVAAVLLFSAQPVYGHDFGHTVYWYRRSIVHGYGYPYAFGYSHGHHHHYAWPYYLDTGLGPWGPFVAPPLYVPAEELGFGPQALRRFIGVDVHRPIVNRNVVVVPPAANALKLENNGINRVEGRRSNAEARDRARRFIEFGDAQFDVRNLAQAYDRYKKAAEAAPDLAEPFFRLGHVQAEMDRYAQAATSFRRGVALDAAWPAAGFKLVEIYKNNNVARESMLVALARAAETNPGDADLHYVAGVQFFFDGQLGKARTYFERARALGEAAASVEPFLKMIGAPAQQQEIDI